MPQKEQKIAAAVYLYQVDNGGEWGEIRYIQSLPEVRLLKKAVVMFDQAM